MYLAKKHGGAVCRIPDDKAEYYKNLGYSVEKLDKESLQESTRTSAKKQEALEKNSLQEGTNPSNE